MSKQENNVLTDIQERLTYVMTTKENAVQQTLASTEEALASVGEMKALLSMLTTSDTGSFSVPAGIDFAVQSRAVMDKIQQGLTDVLMSQGYQDLTGQVLRRVMTDLAQLDMGNQSIVSGNENEGLGPATSSRDKASRVDAQDDVDDLLNSLGI